MTPLRKFSLVYDRAEDRMAWDGEDTQGGAARVWLTQRFCRELVGALVARLPNAPAPAGHEVALQSFEQAAAMSHFGKTPGVTVTPESTAGLVRSVQITQRANGLTLAFAFGEGEERGINLDFAAVRQMLGALHGLHVAAGWPTDFWPAWIADPGAAKVDAALN